MNHDLFFGDLLNIVLIILIFHFDKYVHFLKRTDYQVHYLIGSIKYILLLKILQICKMILKDHLSYFAVCSKLKITYFDYF